MTSAVKGPVGAPPLMRFLLRNFVIYNPMFVFSAMLILVGAWLLNPAQAHGGRDPWLLIKLLGVVQLYEFSLLGAAWVLARRADLKRDVRFLLLIMSPFLLDVTFTTSSLTTGLLNLSDTWQGMFGVGGLFLGVFVPLLWLKLTVAVRLTGQPFSRHQFIVLLAGPVLVAFYPLLASWLPLFGLGPEVGFVGGMGVAGLALLFATVTQGQATANDWLRRLAPLALIAALVHAGATTWTYSGGFLHVVGPVVIALGVALPYLIPALADHRNWLAVALPAVGAVLCGLPEAPVFGAGGWILGLASAGAVWMVMFYRTRSFAFLVGVMAALHCAWGGTSLEASLQAVGHNPVEPVMLLAVLGYGLYKQVHPFFLAVPMLGAAVATARLGLFGNALDVVLALGLVGSGVLVWAHRVHGNGPAGARYRFVGSFLLYVPVYVLALFGDDPAVTGIAHWAGRATVVALLLTAVLTRLRAYGYPAALLPIEGAVRLAPASVTGWGIAGVLAGFVMVCLGVVISLYRERLLAWLGDDESPPLSGDDEGEQDSRELVVPSGAGLGWWQRGAAVTGLTALVVWLVLPAQAFGLEAHRHANESAAIGALKTLGTAQSLFREGDKDQDGVFDYAASLKELGDVGLIDHVLASGVKRGYRFTLIQHPEHPEFLWMAVANPIEWTKGSRAFMTNHEGVTYFAPHPLNVNPECALPQGAHAS